MQLIHIKHFIIIHYIDSLGLILFQYNLRLIQWDRGNVFLSYCCSFQVSQMTPFRQLTNLSICPQNKHTGACSWQMKGTKLWSKEKYDIPQILAKLVQ